MRECVQLGAELLGRTCNGRPTNSLNSRRFSVRSRPFNQVVVGSIPTGLTRDFNRLPRRRRERNGSVRLSATDRCPTLCARGRHRRPSISVSVLRRMGIRSAAEVRVKRSQALLPRIMICDGNAVIAWSALSGSGVEFQCVGKNRREPVDFDGLTLVKFKTVPPPTLVSDAPHPTTPFKV